jgi:hypothetical protein
MFPFLLYLEGKSGVTELSNLGTWSHHAVGNGRTADGKHWGKTTYGSVMCISWMKWSFEDQEFTCLASKWYCLSCLCPRIVHETIRKWLLPMWWEAREPENWNYSRLSRLCFIADIFPHERKAEFYRTVPYCGRSVFTVIRCRPCVLRIRVTRGETRGTPDAWGQSVFTFGWGQGLGISPFAKAWLFLDKCHGPCVCRGAYGCQDSRWDPQPSWAALAMEAPS